VASTSSKTHPTILGYIGGIVGVERRMDYIREIKDNKLIKYNTLN